MRTLAAWLAYAPTVLINTLVLVPILDSVHILGTAIVAEVALTAQARSSPCAATRTFVVARERIASGKPAPALFACMRSLSSVQLRMAFEVVEPPKARLASLAYVRLFLAVSQQVTF